MSRDITRRDFLNGVGLSVAGTMAPALPALGATAAQNTPGYYPPTRDGMRGSHPGSFELAHLVRDGARWEDPSASTDTGEEFDLVVVGGGLSTLDSRPFRIYSTHFSARSAAPTPGPPR